MRGYRVFIAAIRTRNLIQSLDESRAEPLLTRLVTNRSRLANEFEEHDVGRCWTDRPVDTLGPERIRRLQDRVFKVAA